MKRRDILKTAMSASLLCGIFGLSGCKKTEKQQGNVSHKITPKQTSKYMFSAHLPFSFDAIDKIKAINEKYKKSEIKTLYNNLPFISDLDIYQSSRGINISIKSIGDFLKYVIHAKKLGFDFVYLLNSPRPFYQKEFTDSSDSLFKLVSILVDNGCKKFSVANTQLIDMLIKKFPELELNASSIFLFQNIGQFQNLLTTYPMIKSVNLNPDLNRNFELLPQLKKSLPNLEIQLLVNEPCISSCPGKVSHMSINYRKYDCHSFLNKNWYYEFCKSGAIFPWNLEYYSAIGINNFKLISKPKRSINTDIRYYNEYLEMVENGPIPELSLKEFLGLMFNLTEEMSKKIPDNLQLKEIINLLPDINYFTEHGYECIDICDSECNYCKKVAEQLEKKIEMIKNT